jgi:hypothetical protein
MAYRLPVGEDAMEFKTAFRLSQEIEHAHAPELVVVGFRRQRWEDLASWAIDILNTRSNQMATLGEKDDWQVRLERIGVATGERTRYAS